MIGDRERNGGENSISGVHIKVALELSGTSGAKVHGKRDMDRVQDFPFICSFLP